MMVLWLSLKGGSLPFKDTTEIFTDKTTWYECGVGDLSKTRL